MFSEQGIIVIFIQTFYVKTESCSAVSHSQQEVYEIETVKSEMSIKNIVI